MKLSIEYANIRNYLDDLSRVYLKVSDFEMQQWAKGNADERLDAVYRRFHIVSQCSV